MKDDVANLLPKKQIASAIFQTADQLQHRTYSDSLKNGDGGSDSEAWNQVKLLMNAQIFIVEESLK